MGAAVAARRWPVLATCAVVAGAVAMGWAGLTGWAWSDYEAEALVPLQHLVHGRLGLFAQTVPAYGGSLVIRAPFALLAHAAGGGDTAVYRMMAVPCLAAGAVLGRVLWAQRRRRLPEEAPAWALTIALLAAANPVTLRALEIGHPEELLGGALCVGAVLAALGRRPWLSGLLLGLALANKAWAVLAIGPVLVALPGRRAAAQALGLAAAVAVAAVLPLLLGPAGTAHMAAGGTHTGVIFQPWQAWWFLGEHGHVVIGGDGLPKPGYRTPPAWIGPVTHPLIAALVVPATALWAAVRRGAGARAGDDVLLLLALLLLARCVLDPFDTGYYHLPFLLALLAWETRASERPPLLTLVATVLVWGTFEQAPRHLSADAQAALYLGWSLPLAAVLARRAFRGAVRRDTVPARAAATA